MSKSSKPAAAVPIKADAKKVKHMRETFPALSEEEATILLQEHDGSLKQAMDAVLGGERWKKVEKPKKPKQDKPEEITSPLERRAPKEKRDFTTKDKRPSDRAPGATEERKPRVEKKAAAVATPEPAAVSAPVVHQHAEISGTSWVKGKSISFADMLKKSAKASEPTPVAAPAPAAAPTTKPAAEPKPAPAAPAPAAPAPAAAAPAVVAEVKDTDNAKAAAATPAVEKSEAPAPKQRRERKPRVAPEVAIAPAEVSAPSAPAVAQVVESPKAAPPPPTPVAKPVVIQYVLEFDRIAEDVTLPSHIEDHASRFKDAYKFNGTQGRAPTPPPVQVAPAVTVAPASSVATSFPFQVPAPRQAWPVPGEGRPAYNQWTSEAPNNWGTRAPTNFTSYQGNYQQQQQYRTQPPVNHRYAGHNGSHHGSTQYHRGNVHPDHVASDVAYSAIRGGDETRFSGGVW